MRTEEIKIYKFEELTEEAKKIALDQFRDREYNWFEEIKQTMNNFAEEFSLNIDSYELGYGRGTHIICSVTDGKLKDVHSEEGEPLTGEALAKIIRRDHQEKFFNQGAKDGNCPLTGVCFDCNVLDPLVDFMNKPTETSFEELMKDCLNSLEQACSNDVLYNYGDVATKEHIEANEIEFTVIGNNHRS